MGMDVIGKHPRSSAGKYFSASVWTWHPLWDLCCAVAPDVIDAETSKACHFNDGRGLGDAEAGKLAEALERQLEIGLDKVAVLKPSRSEVADAVMQVLGGTSNENGRGSWYELRPERVRDFVVFLRASGGFEVY